MKKELTINVLKGKASLDTGVALKDIISTLEDGSYTVTIEPTLNADSADYYRRRIFAGIDVLVNHTGQPKDVIKAEATSDIINQLNEEGKIEQLVNLDLVDAETSFSLTWLNPRGYKEFYARLKFWAHDKCDCNV